MTIKITKQLATIEDLALGDGTIVQERNGVPLTLRKIDFISRSDSVTLPYSSGIKITNYLQSIDDGERYWRLAPGTALPYTTTGTGMPEGGAFVNVGDAVLRQELAGSPADGLGAALVKGSSVVANSIADIQAMALPVGSVIELNDGGRSGAFDVVAGDFSAELAGDAENGVYVGLSDDPSSTTKVAKRRYGGTINVKWFGAVPDGATDNTVAFRAACAFDAAIFIPAGDYVVTNTINPGATDARHFMGERSMESYGGGRSRILFQDDLLDSTVACIDGCGSVENITIKGSSKTAIGISFSRKGQPAGTFGSYTAQNLWVSGCYIAYFFDSMYSSTFIGINAFENNHGIWVEPVGEFGYITDTLFSSCASNDNDGYAWYVKPPTAWASVNVTFSNCTFEGTSTTVDYIAVFSRSIKPWKAENLYLEGGGGIKGVWLVDGLGEVSGLYHNSTGNIDHSATGSDVTYRNVRFANSGGFGTSYSVTRGFSLHNANVNSLPSVLVDGDFKNVTLPENNVRWNFKRISNSVSIVPDGSAEPLFSLGLDSNYASSSFTVPFSFIVKDSGTIKQQVTGTLTISCMIYAGSLPSDFSAIAVSSLAKSEVGSNTLSDPVFTLTSSDGALVINGALTSSIPSATARFHFDVDTVIQDRVTLPLINTL